MSSGFWLPDRPCDLGVIHHAEDMEAVLLESLRANLFSTHGLNLYARAAREEMMRRREGGEGGGVLPPRRPLPRLSDLPQGHPVREGLEAMLECAGLPSRPLPPTLSPRALETSGTEDGLTSGTATPTAVATSAEEERGAIGDREKGVETVLRGDRETSTEESPGQQKKSAPTPTSALAKLVALARSALPPRMAAGAEDEEDEDGDEDEESKKTTVRHPPTRRTPASSWTLLPSDSTLKPVGEKRVRSPTPDASEPGEEEKENPAMPEPSLETKHPSQMTREEFLSQFKRAPRRGEIGQSAEEIEKAEALGYVMSGSRSKASHLFINRVQRQLHERDAAKWEQQFRQVEDERMNARLIDDLTKLVKTKLKRDSTSDGE